MHDELETPRRPLHLAGSTQRVCVIGAIALPIAPTHPLAHARPTVHSSTIHITNNYLTDCREKAARANTQPTGSKACCTHTQEGGQRGCTARRTAASRAWLQPLRIYNSLPDAACIRPPPAARRTPVRLLKPQRRDDGQSLPRAVMAPKRRHSTTARHMAA